MWSFVRFDQKFNYDLASFNAKQGNRKKNIAAGREI